MAIQWGLAGEGYDALQSLQVAGQAQQMRLRQQEQQRAMAEAQRKAALQQQVGGLAAQGNYTGGRNLALNNGDFDLVGHIDSLDDRAKKQTLEGFQQLGQYALLADTPEKWDAAVQHFVAQGHPEAQGYLGQFGMRDNIIANAGLAKDYAERMKPVVLSDGSQLYRPDGTMLAENAADPKYQAVPEGGMLVRTNPNGATQPVMGSQTGPVSFNGIPGERVTSGYRTPEHNREVGGVGNSYHTRRGPDGQPLARDSVPPAGMSMGAYAAQLRRENPSLEVINEGDHVHMEPRGGGSRGGGTPDVIMGRPKVAKPENAPSGYRYNGSRLEPIPGGPADPTTATARNVQSNRKAEADFRKEFDALPEVKTFKTARQQFNALRNIAGNPKATAQDDIAAIFSFMKTLDPNSTVREGEFATAQNAAGVPAAIQNAWNKAQSGERLNPQQRQEMIRTAYRSYQSFRDAYNQAAENYRGYARDNGIVPDRVARTYTPDKPANRSQQPLTYTINGREFRAK